MEEPPETIATLSLARRSAVECLGTAFLLMTVVGSGIMADRLSAGNAGLALLANSIATGAGLTALILTLEPYSGAHLNPAVTVADAFLRGRPWRDVAAYAAAQVLGAFLGVVTAHAMFGQPLMTISGKARDGMPLVLAELVATLGLLAVIFLPGRSRGKAVAVAVGGYIAAAYWFTSSTSFANPALTLARSLTGSFTGIRPADVPGFLIGQAAGTCVFALFARGLSGPPNEQTRSSHA